MRQAWSLLAVLAVAAGCWSLIFLAPLCGCSSYPAPVRRLATAEDATIRARELGAEKDPQASIYYELAQDELARAKDMLRMGHHERADYMLLRAKADADLAIAMRGRR